MLSTTEVIKNPIPLKNGVEKHAEKPETDDFDFTEYMLGLKASEKDDAKASGKLDAEETDPSKKSSKDATLWNTLFPGLTTTNQASEPSAQNASDLLQGQKGERLGVGADKLALGIWDANGAQPDGTAAAATPNLPTPDFAAIQQREVLNRYGETGRLAEANSKSGAMKLANDPTADVSSLLPQAKAALTGNLASAVENGHESSEKRSGTEFDELSALTGMGGAGTGAALNVAPTANHVAQNANTQQTATMPALFQNVTTLVQNGGGKMTVSLNPPHLGEVEIQVTAKGNRVEVEMRSDNSATRSLIESQIGELKTSLHANDMVLSKVEVHAAREFTPNLSESQLLLSQNGQGGTAFQQSQAFSDRGGNPQRSFRPQTESSSSARFASVSAVSSGTRAMAAGAGRLDLRI